VLGEVLQELDASRRRACPFRSGAEETQRPSSSEAHNIRHMPQGGSARATEARRESSVRWRFNPKNTLRVLLEISPTRALHRQTTRIFRAMEPP